MADTKKLLTQEIDICTDETILLKMLSKLSHANIACVCPKCNNKKSVNNKFCAECQEKIAVAAKDLNVSLKSLERSVMININRKNKKNVAVPDKKEEKEKEKEKEKETKNN